MADVNTVRILEIDGGGERGYLSLKFLQKFIQQWGIQQNELSKYFDVICGTSIGGIQALAYAFGLGPNDISSFFTSTGPYIFSLTSLVPSVRPNLAAKLALIATDTPFYQSSGPTAAQYGYGLLQATLTNQFGTSTLQDLQTNVLIPSYQFDTQTYVLFSNLNYPDYIGQNETIKNVALATASAPIYFPSANFNSHVYIDGGVYQNNPATLGLSLGKALKPTANRYCVFSLGTGIGEMGFDPGNPDVVDARVSSLVAAPMLFNSVQTIFQLFNISSTGGQESVAKSLYFESEYSLQQLYYYRFQPQLDPNLNTELDNTDPEILTYYEDTATTYYNSDIDNISTFIGHLTA